MKIWGIVAILYAAMVIVIAVLKPGAIWKMKKIKFFIKHFGDRGTEIFFYIWAFLFMVLGVWFLTR